MKKVDELINKMKQAQLEKDTKTAVSYLQAATQRLDLLSKEDPQNASIPLKKAQVYMSVQAHKFAEKDLLKAISIDPTNAETLYLLGQVYLKTNNFRLANEAYDKFFLLDEVKASGVEHAKVYFERAVARNGLFWYDEALQDLDKAAELNPQLPHIQKSIETIQKNKEEADK